MAIKYIKEGSGTGTGTLADPYFFSQIATAEVAAGSGGTLYFTDGTYDNVGTWDESGLTYESLNLHGALITGTAVTLGSASNSITFKKFKVRPDATELIYIYGATTLVDQIDHAVASSQCIRVYTDGAKLTNSLILNDMTSGAIIMRDADLFSEITGCTIFIKGLNGKSADAVNFHSGNPDNMKNCIFTSDDTANNVVNSAATLATNSTNCCFFQFGTGNASGGTDNKFADPLFVTAPTDLRLRPGSPCINAGTTS